jgi:hypothetical protein
VHGWIGARRLRGRPPCANGGRNQSEANQEYGEPADSQQKLAQGTGGNRDRELWHA